MDVTETEKTNLRIFCERMGFTFKHCGDREGGNYFIDGIIYEDHEPIGGADVKTSRCDSLYFTGKPGWIIDDPKQDEMIERLVKKGWRAWYILAPSDGQVFYIDAAEIEHFRDQFERVPQENMRNNQGKDQHIKTGFFVPFSHFHNTLWDDEDPQNVIWRCANKAFYRHNRIPAS